MSNRAAKLQKAFGAAVRAEREANALTQEKLAENAELSLNYIGNLERGEKMASLETVVRVAEANSESFFLSSLAVGEFMVVSVSGINTTFSQPY